MLQIISAVRGNWNIVRRRVIRAARKSALLIRLLVRGGVEAAREKREYRVIAASPLAFLDIP